jgi:predicted porin
MKKSLIALAALSTIAGSVAAQSSVTIYGRINPGVANQELVDGAGKRTETTGYQANGWTSPRLGLNIVEQMDGGLSAVGVWETNIATEGASTGTVRQAFAGVKGGFGQVTIGNQYTTEYAQGINVAGTVNSYGFGSSVLNLDSTAVKTNTAVHRLGELSQGNVISFSAPAIGGVTLTAQLGKSVAETTNAAGSALTTNTESDTFGIGANYVAGPLTAALSYAESKASNLAVTADYIKTAGTTSTTVTRTSSCTASTTSGSEVACQTITAGVDAADTKQKNWTASGTYTLGNAKLFAYYADRELTGTTALDYKTYNLGAQYTVGKFTPFAQMSDGKMKNSSGATTKDLSSYQVGATYAFSKRTTGYAYVAEYKDKAVTSGTNSKKAEVTSVGVAHTF